MRLRPVPWWYLSLAAGSLAGVIGYTLLPLDPGPRARVFLVLQVAMAAPAAVALLWRRDRPISIAWVLAVAAVLRLACLPGELIFENDVFRYLWDARVWAAGINPYAHAPAAPELAHLVDDWVFPQIPYRQVPTIYPPVAQVVFVLARGLFGESVEGLQVVLAAFDLGTVWLLGRLGEAVGVSRAAAVYALHPLAIKEFGQSAHIDAAAIFFVTLGLLCIVRRRPFEAAGALAAATLVKVFPLALVPLLWRRLGTRPVLLYSALVAAPLVALGLLSHSPLVGFGAFARYWIYNPSLYDALANALAQVMPIEAGYTWARPLCGAAVLAIAVSLAWRTRVEDDRAFLTAACATVFALLLFSPAANPWYVAWLAPLSLVGRHPAALVWTGSVALAYGFHLEGTDHLALRVVEYLPVFALLGWQGWRRVRPTVATA